MSLAEKEEIKNMITNFEIVMNNRIEGRKEIFYFDDLDSFNWRLLHTLSMRDFININKKVSSLNNRFNFDITVKVEINYTDADTIELINVFTHKNKKAIGD